MIAEMFERVARDNTSISARESPKSAHFFIIKPQDALVPRYLSLERLLEPLNGPRNS